MSQPAGQDPADQIDEELRKEGAEGGVPADQRMPNAGGTMSETHRSRDADLDDEMAADHNDPNRSGG